MKYMEVPMNIDAMSNQRDMRYYVESAMAISRESDQDDSQSSIISSISFSSMLENAIKVELLKEN